MKKRNKSGGNPGDEALRAKLRQITPGKEGAPERLKEEVFSSLDTLQLVADITSLFTVQFTRAEMEILDAITYPPASEEEE